MINIKTKRYLVAGLLLVLAFMLTLCVMYSGANSNKKAYAATIDYSNIDYTSLTYHDIPGGFNVATEDVIYKISCKNPRPYVNTDTDYLDEYVTVVSFRAAMGCQIYFVDGMTCNKEDIDYEDYQWDYYSNYFEVLHYDSTNQFMYCKFKNLANLDADDNVSASLEDVSMWLDDTTYNSEPQYIFLSEIETPVTEITADDVYFSTTVKAGTGAYYPTGYNIYSLEYMLKINQKVAHLVDSKDVTFVAGGDEFTLTTTVLGLESGNGWTGYEYITLGQIDDITTDVQLKAVITYGDKSITVLSPKTNLITLWQALVNSGFSGYDYETYLTDTNKEIITKLVSAYNAGFFAEIKGSQAYFTTYDSSNSLQVTSLIFRVPVENFSYASFGWSTDYFQGYCYYGNVSINDKFVLSASVYKMRTNEDGTVTVALDADLSTNTGATGSTEHNTTAETQLLNATEYFAYDGYVYVRINDFSMVEQYFPQRADKSFSAYARTTSGSTNVLEANTATIIYDDYNKELLAQIESLSAQLSELQAQLEASNLLSESQKEQINQLNSTIDGLRLDYSNAQNELAYVNQQIEVMREEYQKKIDQLIQENDGKVPSDNNGNNNQTPSDDTIEENGGLSPVALGGILMGAFLVVAVVMLLIPSKRRKNK